MVSVVLRSFFIKLLNKSDKRWLWPMFGELRLLGIDFAHIPEKVTLVDSQGFRQQWQVEVHAGMMGVISSWYLLDFIKTSAPLIEQRRRDDDLYAKESSSTKALIDAKDSSETGV